MEMFVFVLILAGKPSAIIGPYPTKAMCETISTQREGYCVAIYSPIQVYEAIGPKIFNSYNPKINERI